MMIHKQQTLNISLHVIVQILGLVVLGLGIWVVVDQPSFFDILDDATNVCDGWYRSVSTLLHRFTNLFQATLNVKKI